MYCSTPGFPVHHQLPELAQTLVHRVDAAIQPSHPLSPSCPPAFSLSQHQGLFQWVSSSHQVARVLEFQLQHQSFQWIVRTDFLSDWLVWSLCSPRDSQESSLGPQLENINSSAFFMVQLSHLYMTTGKTIALATQTFVDKMVSLFFNMLGITQLPCLQPSSSGELGYNHLGGWFYLLCNIFGDRHQSWECAWGGISCKPPSLAAHFIAYGINY